jgi:hypothetical protein
MSKDKNKKVNNKKKTFKDVAYDILYKYDKGDGLHSDEITKLALKEGILVTEGSTPELTMNSVIITDINEKDNKSRFIKTGPSKFSINKNWVPKKEEVRSISKHLSPTQKGDIAEARIAELITIYSDEALSCYRPISDDEGIDIIVKKKSSKKIINIQVKSVWKNKGPIVSSVKEERLNSLNDIYVVFCMFDIDKGDLWDYVWLVPGEDFKRITKEHSKERKDGLLIFVAGRSKRDTNMWDKYLIDRRDLGNKILKYINKK